jgi:hypothetical protein
MREHFSRKFPAIFSRSTTEDFNMPDETLRADLADGSDPLKGAALVAFKQPGTGAYARTVRDKLLDTIDLLDFVDPALKADVIAGTQNASPAMQAAIDEAVARTSPCAIRIPPGKFRLDSRVMKTLGPYTCLTIEGAGPELSQFIVNNSEGGFNIICHQAVPPPPPPTIVPVNSWLNIETHNSIRLSNFAVCAYVVHAAKGTGIRIDGQSVVGTPAPPCILENLVIRAHNQVNTQAFEFGLHLYDVSAIYATSCRFLVGGVTNAAPTAVKIEASAESAGPTDIYFNNCTWIFGGIGIQAGNYIEGIHVTNCDMVKVGTGIQWYAPALGESGLHVVGGHFNCLVYNFDLDYVNDMAITGIVSYLSETSGAAHVRVRNGSTWNISGCTFSNTTVSVPGVGILVGPISSVTRCCSISGNTFNLLPVGISIANGTNGLFVGLNAYAPNCEVRIYGTPGLNSHVQQRTWNYNSTSVLVGGASTEDVDIPIPVGVFKTVPKSVQVTAEASTAQMLCLPMWGNPATTETNVRVRFFRNGGGTIAGGAVRVHIAAFGD